MPNKPIKDNPSFRGEKPKDVVECITIWKVKGRGNFKVGTEMIAFIANGVPFFLKKGFATEKVWRHEKELENEFAPIKKDD